MYLMFAFERLLSFSEIICDIRFPIVKVEVHKDIIVESIDVVFELDILVNIPQINFKLPLKPSLTYPATVFLVEINFTLF